MELYRKIYIKSEADLPKEGRYYCHSIGTEAFREGVFLFDREDMQDPEIPIDWYLQPVGQEKHLPTDEDIEKWVKPPTYHQLGDYTIEAAIIWGAKAMRDGLIKNGK